MGTTRAFTLWLGVFALASCGRESIESGGGTGGTEARGSAGSAGLDVNAGQGGGDGSGVSGSAGMVSRLCRAGSSCGFGQRPTGTCDEEGTYCCGTWHPDLEHDVPWGALCCSGQWHEIGWPSGDDTPICPPAAEPGDEIGCGLSNAGPVTHCVVGESYCLERKDELEVPAYSCDPVCRTGDCSCFCSPSEDGSCDFIPKDAACPADACSCMRANDENGIPIPGTVSVSCRYEPKASRCYRDDEVLSCGARLGYLCVDATPPGSCEDVVTYSGVCGVDAVGYCCAP